MFKVRSTGGSFPDVWEASAVQCERSAQEEIQTRLAKHPLIRRQSTAEVLRNRGVPRSTVEEKYARPGQEAIPGGDGPMDPFDEETAIGVPAPPAEPGRTDARLAEPGTSVLDQNSEAIADQQEPTIARNASRVPAQLPVKDEHLNLLKMILEKRPTTLEKWAGEHKLGRTTVFDWKAGRGAGKSLKGKVSDAKITAIEKAIEDDAKALGLPTRTRSD